MAICLPTLLDNLLKEVESQFESQTHVRELLAISKKLQVELQEQLRRGDSQAMLPSFNYELPTGHEGGRYLALEVGGSNLLVALVELYGRDPPIGHQPMKIRCIMSFPIDAPTRQLQEYTFFDWIVERVIELLKKDAKDSGYVSPCWTGIQMGVAYLTPKWQCQLLSARGWPQPAPDDEAKYFVRPPNHSATWPGIAAATPGQMLSIATSGLDR